MVAAWCCASIRRRAKQSPRPVVSWVSSWCWRWRASPCLAWSGLASWCERAWTHHRNEGGPLPFRDVSAGAMPPGRRQGAAVYFDEFAPPISIPRLCGFETKARCTYHRRKRAHRADLLRHPCALRDPGALLPRVRWRATSALGVLHPVPTAPPASRDIPGAARVAVRRAGHGQRRPLPSGRRSTFRPSRALADASMPCGSGSASSK